jgi:ferredoxin
MLVDIYSCVPPDLTIMDGITAMEGEGPGSGKPRDVGAVLISQDGAALDAVSAKIIGFDPMALYTNLVAHERGIGATDLREIEILGEKLSDFVVKDFKHSALATGMLRRKIPQFMHAFIQRETKYIPDISQKKCTSCMECVKICPTSAAHSKGDIPVIDRKRCIQCMCCHEVCRDYAIDLKRSFYGKGIEVAAKVYRFAGSLFSR